MSEDTEMVEICLELPRYLVRFLNDFSREIAMTPSQLLANILHLYYEASLVGQRMYASKSKKCRT